MSYKAGKQDIRRATLSETASVLIEWAAKEGWNPGLHDAGCFYNSDPNGFFIGTVDDLPVSCISLVKYNQDFAFLGFYIVHPDFRGMGYGYEIWKTAMEYAGKTNTGLDGVTDQQENYQKSGFRFAYRNIRYEGKSQRYPTINTQNIELITPQTIDAVLTYDAPLFPAKRSVFLRNWIFQPGHYAYAFCVNNDIKGYLVLRECRTGFKAGPLFADSPEIAEHLLLHATGQLDPGTRYFVDIPEVNTATRHIIHKTGLQKVFVTARMYTGETPDIDLSKIFGITSFELG
ncbi:MAG: GNAT family N-acetyltransferase [Lentimicrobium sp.]